MIHFNCDYLEGAVPEIIKRLSETNMEQTVGYGLDPHCENAVGLIKKACGNDSVDVHLLVGGTQTNLTVISASLRPHQGVISVKSGHINCHEAGAIESCGHKVIPLDGENGKLSACEIESYLSTYYADDTHEHIVQPKMVYISFPTETGTLYSKKELSEIYGVCKKWGLYLFIDGARLGYGLCAEGNDVTMSDLPLLCDVFYIGGTKIGALFGEAVVIVNDSLKSDFRWIMKQKGAILAKGRLLGIQFEVLFENCLYLDISRHAISLAMELKKGFKEIGIETLWDSPTNQQFVHLSAEKVMQIDGKFEGDVSMRYPDGGMDVRFCTSWATKDENVRALLEALK